MLSLCGRSILLVVLTCFAACGGGSSSTTTPPPPPPAAAAPTFWPPAGTYSPTQISLSDATANASIYYTTDGSTPTASSTKYTAPLAIAATSTIKAMATASGYSASAVSSSAYTVPAQNGNGPVVSLVLTTD